MKKPILLFLSMLITGFVFADNAIVASVKGKVEVNRNNTWIQVKPGDKIAESEMISTGFNSEAKIKYNDSVLYLAALTRVTLDTLISTSTTDKVNVYLNTGAVRSKVNHTENKRVSYTVRNPIAVASVRGTDFVMTDNSSIECFNGAVAVCPTFMVNTEALFSTNVAELPSGSANANTASSDISNIVPENSLVVAANQSVTFNTTGEVVNVPANDIYTNLNKIVLGVSSASIEDAITSSPSTLSNPVFIDSKSAITNTNNDIVTTSSIVIAVSVSE